MSKIAILATGDEIVNGDILNSNAKRIAEELVSLGFTVGFHMVVSDDQDSIVTALRFLSTIHDIVIITGGLGPTSDDRTRFAASEVTNSPLVFSEENWQVIMERFKKIALPVHDCNRVQALYPKDSDIIPNDNGTAAGFTLHHQTTRYFFLPGPPSECIPMFLSFVLPHLQELYQIEKMQHKFWRLFGVNEGEIAAILDDRLKPYPLETGYRFEYPYLEFKIRTKEASLIDSVTPLIEELLKPHILSHNEIPASIYLRDRLAHHFKGQLLIHDEATGGLLQTAILTPKTQAKVHFHSFNPVSLKPNEIGVEIQGLKELWQQQMEPGKTQLILHFYSLHKTETQQHLLPYRENRIRQYSLEFIADRINQFLNQLPKNLNKTV